MKLRPLFLLLVVAAAPLCADVTHRMALRLEPSKTLPADLVEAMTRGLTGSMQALSLDCIVRGNRAYLRVGTYVTVSDFDSGRVTLIDQTGKRFATADAAQYAHAQQEWLQKMRPDQPRRIPAAPFRPTGKKKALSGIPVEEYELVLGESTDGQSDSVLTAVTFWIPTPHDTAARAALKELDRYVRRAFVPIPYTAGLAELSGLEAASTELDEAVRKLGVPLEIRTVMGLGRGSQIIGLVLKTTELSGAGVSPDMFEVPAGYRPAQLDHLLPEMLSQASAGAGPVVAAPVMPPGTEDPAPPR